MDAARELFSRQGVEATRIQEITDAADVGFGSFYNHFADKNQIVEAVIDEMTELQASAVDQLTAGLDDPAEVVSIAHRYFLRLASTDPIWGWLMIQLDASHRLLAGTLAPRALRDLLAGVEAGRFSTADPILTINASGGALLGATRAILEGSVAENADQHHAEMVLRMLGVPAAEAAEISQRDLPVPSAG